MTQVFELRFSKETLLPISVQLVVGQNGQHTVQMITVLLQVLVNQYVIKKYKREFPKVWPKYMVH